MILDGAECSGGRHSRGRGGFGFIRLFFVFSLIKREALSLKLIDDRLQGELLSYLYIFHMNKVVKFVSFNVNGLNGLVKRKRVLTYFKKRLKRI